MKLSWWSREEGLIVGERLETEEHQPPTSALQIRAPGLSPPLELGPQSTIPEGLRRY